jgi:membrane-bound metal-dependent hydrolase YbcI (DUF457 family)
MSPSPIAHSAMGYLLGRVFVKNKPLMVINREIRNPWVILAALFFSLLPDIDAIPGILLNDFGRYHNQWTHSLAVGLGVSLLVGFVAYWRRRSFGFWFLLASLSYTFHIIMDYFTMGDRGLMLFWPFTSERFLSPIPLFWGVRWSEGLWSPLHLITIATELLFVALVMLVISIIERKNRRSGQVMPDYDRK